jgi:hypothetical protein
VSINILRFTIANSYHRLTIKDKGARIMPPVNGLNFDRKFRFLGLENCIILIETSPQTAKMLRVPLEEIKIIEKVARVE